MSPTKNAGSVARQTSLQLIRIYRKGGLFLTLCVCDMIPENWENYLFKVAIFTDIVLNHLRVLL